MSAWKGFYQVSAPVYTDREPTPREKELLRRAAAREVERVWQAWVAEDAALTVRKP